MVGVIETLRPSPVPIKLYRGTDNIITFTILGPDGLPKDMSAYAAVVPQIRFTDKPRSSGGTQPPGNYPQAQLSAGNEPSSKGKCVWLDGGVGGQIQVVVPELDISNTGGTDTAKGSKNGIAASPPPGVFDIQVRCDVDLTTVGATGVSNGTEGTVSAYHNIQRAVTGTWTIDNEVTDI